MSKRHQNHREGRCELKSCIVYVIYSVFIVKNILKRADIYKSEENL